jgi:hypothetical protein
VALAPTADPVIAVGLDLRGDARLVASQYVGCRFDGAALRSLSAGAALIGCVLDATDATDAQVVGALSPSHPTFLLLARADERVAALEQLLASGAADLLPILCSFVGDSEWLVRSLVVQIAARHWLPTQPGAAIVARTLSYALGDEHSMVQLAAQDLTRHVGLESGFADDVVGELDSSLADLRLRALRALVTLHRLGREAGLAVDERTWRRLLADAGAEMRVATIDTLAQIDHHCPLSLVTPLTSDADETVRQAAQQLLEEQS